MKFHSAHGFSIEWVNNTTDGRNKFIITNITVVVPCSHHASKFSHTPTWTITTILSIIISWSCQVIFKTDYITITPSPSSEWSTTKKWDWCWYYFHTHDFLLLTNATAVILFKIWLIYWTHLLLLLFNSCLHLYLLENIFTEKYNILYFILHPNRFYL